MEINLKLTISSLLPAVFMLLLPACGGGSQIADTPTREAKVVAKVGVEPSSTTEATQQKTGTAEQGVIFWNAPMANVPKRTADFEFSHELADPKEVLERYRRNVEANPLRRLARPDDIASAALFLVSDEASFINGQTVAVDGGSIAGTALY